MAESGRTNNLVRQQITKLNELASSARDLQALVPQSADGRTNEIFQKHFAKVNELIDITRELLPLANGKMSRQEALVASINREMENRVFPGHPKSGSNHRGWLVAGIMRDDRDPHFATWERVVVYLTEAYHSNIGENYAYEIAIIKFLDNKVYAALVKPRGRGNYPEQDEEKTKQLIPMLPVDKAGGLEGITKTVIDAIIDFLAKGEKFE